MRAARLHEFGEPFRIDEVPDPEPGPGEVLVRIGGAGVCHSDLHIAHGETPILLDGPKIMGHENAGWVEALGPGRDGVRARRGRSSSTAAGAAGCAASA